MHKKSWKPVEFESTKDVWLRSQKQIFWIPFIMQNFADFFLQET